MDPRVMFAIKQTIAATSLLLGQEAAVEVAALLVKKYGVPADVAKDLDRALVELQAVHRKARSRSAEVAAESGH